MNGQELATHIREVVLERSAAARVGHIGSALCVAEILGVVYAEVLVGEADDPDRDRFVLSKGHAALALYAALHGAGRLDDDRLTRFVDDGGELAGHPEHLTPGVDFSTGSLGHGLSLAAGAALAARRSGSSRRAIALLSDAECNEGSVWEAAAFAAHHALGNLVAIVDLNGQQALGQTSEILDMAPLDERWSAFGWRTVVVDGHDPAAIRQAIPERGAAQDAPTAIIARTVFGRGVSFMESRLEWHYLPMTDEQYRQAREEVGRSVA